MIPTKREYEWFRDLMMRELDSDHGAFSLTLTSDGNNRKLTYKKSFADGTESVISFEVDSDYNPLLPLLDYRQERERLEKQNLKSWIGLGMLALVWSLVFFIVTLIARSIPI